jgi:putative DNA primase/helicase
MVALGSVIGRKVGVRPKQEDNWTEVPNLWGCIVGSPGVLKTPALQEVLRPLRQLDFRAMESFEVERRAWKVGELQKKASLRKAKPESDFSQLLEEEQPQAKRYVVNDSSPEALGEILRKPGNHPLVYRDELVGLLKALDKEGNESARAFYLEAWGGKEPYCFDRITRGMNLRIEALCFSMLGSIQPSVIGGYLRQAIAGGGADGLMARFGMLVWPDMSHEWKRSDRKPNEIAAADAVRRFEWLDALTPESVGAVVEDGRIPFLRLALDAQEMFWQWLERLDKRLRSQDEHPAFEAHLSKYRKLVPALALVIHLIDEGKGVITPQAVARALAWAEYLESHAARAYASVLRAEAEGARALLRRILKGEVSSPFTERDIYRNHWLHLASLEQTSEACRMLEAHGFIRSERHLTGGRPSLHYLTHPEM